EEYIKSELPGIRVLRMDQDTTRKKGAHIDILNRFANNEADILLGTQMVSKGLDFPSVALVGVIQADISLHFPDFRASEKTFQLLTQVAGRAGRSDNSGEVIIQTYFPEDNAIIAAKNHDYESFFSKEIDSRKELMYPPFGKLARIVVQGKDEASVKSAMYNIFAVAKRVSGPDLKTLGPSLAAVQKIALDHRYSLLIKSSSSAKLGAVLDHIRKASLKVPKTVKVIIDVDPVNML
ncbi:MAG: primosomal protein N', partial [Fibrobacter sp.]|nr:primosomal protein N' [Fibrobacter sp.]